MGVVIARALELEGKNWEGAPLAPLGAASVQDAVVNFTGVEFISK